MLSEANTLTESSPQSLTGPFCVSMNLHCEADRVGREGMPWSRVHGSIWFSANTKDHDLEMK